MIDFGRRSNIDEQAAYWFLRLREDDVSAEEIAEALDWQDESAAHRAAFVRVEGMWRRLEGVVRPPLPKPIGLVHSASRRVRRLPLAAAAALLIATLGYIAFHPSLHGVHEPARLTTNIVPERPSGVAPPSAEPIRYATAPGENRTVILDDGSEIVLGGASTVSVSYSPFVRRISLAAGEALFRVQKNPARPFIVNSAGGETLAVGTVFDVHRGLNDVTVTVIEGVVRVQSDVSRSVPAAMVTAQLAAGHRISYSPKGALGPISEASVKRVTSWENGELTFVDLPLADVVVDLNRYSPKPIAIDDDDAKTFRITGMVTIGKIDEWLRALERNLPVKVVEAKGQITLVEKDEHPKSTTGVK